MLRAISKVHILEVELSNGYKKTAMCWLITYKTCLIGVIPASLPENSAGHVNVCGL
jgi:hypothetical protein